MSPVKVRFRLDTHTVRTRVNIIIRGPASSAEWNQGGSNVLLDFILEIKSLRSRLVRIHIVDLGNSSPDVVLISWAKYAFHLGFCIGEGYLGVECP